MTKILEIRDQIRNFYGQYEIYVKPAIRFLIALVVFFMINGTMGYQRSLNNPAVAIGMALVCTFLPVSAVAVLAAILILVHLFALSLEVCIVALLLFLLMFFMYYKYAPGNGYGAVLTPVLCQLGVAECVPTVIGLCKGPYSVISMVCGIVTFYFLKGVRVNQSLLGSTEDDNMISKFTIVLQQIVGNEELYLVLAAFTVTGLVVYFIRRQSFPHAWKIAVGVGNALNFLILLAGSFLTGTTGRIPWILLGTVIAVLVGLGMEFFLFNLDYSRTERVQFEDDEYYYYVKAIPKIYVSGTEMQVKQINSVKENGFSKEDLLEQLEIDQKLLDELSE